MKTGILKRTNEKIDIYGVRCLQSTDLDYVDTPDIYELGTIVEDCSHSASLNDGRNLIMYNVATDDEEDKDVYECLKILPVLNIFSDKVRRRDVIIYDNKEFVVISKNSAIGKEVLEETINFDRNEDLDVVFDNVQRVLNNWFNGYVKEEIVLSDGYSFSFFVNSNIFLTFSKGFIYTQIEKEPYWAKVCDIIGEGGQLIFEKDDLSKECAIAKLISKKVTKTAIIMKFEIVAFGLILDKVCVMMPEINIYARNYVKYVKTERDNKYYLDYCLKHGNKVIDKTKQEYLDFKSAKEAYIELILKVGHIELFDENVNHKRLSEFLFDFKNADDYSEQFYKTFKEYISNGSVNDIKELDIPEYAIYNNFADQNREDDEADIHAEINGVNNQFKSANEDPFIDEDGGCGTDGYYIYSLKKTIDDEYIMYMTPTDHEKNIYHTTGTILCNSLKMEKENKNYFFFMQEMTNNESKFPIHEEGPISVSISLAHGFIIKN